jgi:hypothetical protein
VYEPAGVITEISLNERAAEGVDGTPDKPNLKAVRGSELQGEARMQEDNLNINTSNIRAHCKKEGRHYSNRLSAFSGERKRRYKHASKRKISRVCVAKRMSATRIIRRARIGLSSLTHKCYLVLTF